MDAISLDYPLIVLLAVLSALPLGWPVIRAFGRSVADDIEDAVESPILSYFGWFPEWTLLKLFWLVVVLSALSVAFYKFYTFIGGIAGLLD